MNDDKEVYVCVTLYHLYLSLLLINSNKSKDNSVIILNANDRQIFLQFCELRKSLEENGYMTLCRLRNKMKDILGFEEIENRKQYKLLNKKFNADIDGKFVLYNFAWNMQYVYTTANLLFKKCKYSYFIEEGALTAINPPQSSIKVFIKKMMGTIVNFYKEPKLKAVFVQKAELYPELWKEKLKILYIDKLTAKLDEKTKNIILKIFMGDFLDKLSEGKWNDIGIIYTQPLSEDGFITEKEKIECYKKMVVYYSKYGKPIVKLHPRDLTDYKFDSDVCVIPPYFPSELLNLIDIHFLYAVGICTSAVPTSRADVKMNINENFLTDLKFELKPII